MLTLCRTSTRPRKRLPALTRKRALPPRPTARPVRRTRLRRQPTTFRRPPWRKRLKQLSIESCIALHVALDSMRDPPKTLHLALSPSIFIYSSSTYTPLRHLTSIPGFYRAFFISLTFFFLLFFVDDDAPSSNWFFVIIFLYVIELPSPSLNACGEAGL